MPRAEQHTRTAPEEPQRERHDTFYNDGAQSADRYDREALSKRASFFIRVKIKNYAGKNSRSFATKPSGV